ncbi:hypothetical protein HG263_21700 [Pseudoalteromonas sp. JBTF-M23]|uniref:Uncharacterized protein n=1 Tax=Pseudoalteromonas caenipelagi TaxID=2726988 RepID=A0A849VH81_9GAMM|nr:hypothetical protein [Pseudoalteromonas caenipelagi]NOU53119.1 hypothetical protein [Pseudoalteromonas caenipelagi]
MGRNWEWSKNQGRIKRLKAEVAARQSGQPFDASNVPLHSYDGTMQSKFAHGWHSVTETDIRRKLSNDNTYTDVRHRLAELFGERDE